jgi:prepilin-type N-terminal cleavage/methylation domain-containing protein
MKSYKAQNRGFTLIEILVVIGIIAVLAAIVIVAINPARQFAQARDSQRQSNVSAILNAVGQYIADHKGNLPTVPAKGAAAVEVGTTLCNDLVPTYLPSLSTDPSSAKKGESLTNCADATAGNVRYFISQDNNGRITVTAPDAEISSTTVTR